MNKGLALMAAGSLAALATPSFAQTYGQTYNDDFSGPWVAGVAGYDINKAGSSVDNDLDPDVNESAEGVVYGVAAGYDVDLGNLVVGAEAELTDSTADSDYGNDFVDFGLGSVDAERDIYLGARAGVELMPQMLVYAKGGYTNARFNFVGSDGALIYDERLDADGYRIGAGVEQKFGDNLSGKLEYRYSNYNEGEIDFEAENIPDTDQFDIDLDRHQIMAGLGWRF